VLLIGVASASAATTTRACGTSGTFTITDDWVVSNTNCAGAITIPNTVTAIANYAFRDATMLTNVSFESPSNVVIIGAYSFYGASSLSSITIPTSVTDIGESAFRAGTVYGDSILGRPGPSSLAKVSFDSPSKVTSIGARAFQDASSLESITIPGSVTSIGLGAFSTASRLASVYFEGSVAPAVASYAFQSVATSATAYRIAGATGFDTVGTTPPLWNGLQVAEYLPAPKAPVAVAGVQLAEVTITPAGFGRAASSYWVTASPGGSVCEVQGASGKCAIYGLTAGVSYTFTAAARTTDPSLMSFASVASNAVVPNPITSWVSRPGFKQTATGMTVTILASEPGLVKMLVVEAGNRALRAKPLVVCSASKNVKSATRFPLKCKYSKAVRARLAQRAMRVTMSISLTPTSSHVPSSFSKSLMLKRLRIGASKPQHQ
jgi:hypothetical protein